MVVPLFPGSAFPVLNRFLWTPLYTRETLLTFVPPDGLAFLNRYVLCGTNLLANSARCTSGVGEERFVHLDNRSKSLSIDQRKNLVLDIHAFFRRPCSPVVND